jgi:hypothetical protein
MLLLFFSLFLTISNTKEKGAQADFCLLEEGGWLAKVILCKVGFRGVL